MDYSQEAINNINIVLKLIKLRLNNWHREFDVYTTDQMVSFATESLSRLNCIPPFTNLKWDDTSYLQPLYNDLADMAACLLMEDLWEVKIKLQKKAIS